MTKYKYGVAKDGTREWMREAMYDRYTSAPVIIHICATKKEAEGWIAAEEKRQSDAIAILPGQGEHAIYGIYDLDTPEAYMSRQNARDACNIGLLKKALMARLSQK